MTWVVSKLALLSHFHINACWLKVWVVYMLTIVKFFFVWKLEGYELRFAFKEDVIGGNLGGKGSVH